MATYNNLDFGYSPSADVNKFNCAVIGGWMATAWQEEKYDWNYYSKSWHRSHGAKITVTGRYVRFTSPSGKKVKTVSLDGWRGNWQARAILEAGLVKPQKGQMHIRLNEAFEIKSVRKVRGYHLYKRTLKGDFVDFCLVSPMGLTSHAKTYAECLAQLSKKRRAIKRREQATIDFKFLRSLGFCEAGIKEFCSVFGLDPKSNATPNEVYNLVKDNPAGAAPFEKELRILADVVGFKVPNLL